MAGVDTVRGIAFQQAQAVLAALDVLDSTDLTALRVEGADDVVDIELFGKDGALRHGKQVKTRQTQYTWGQSELLEVMRRWASLPTAVDATFEFLTDGRLGPTGQEVKIALDAAATGNRAPLAKLLQEDSDSNTCAVLSKARIRVDQTSSGAVLQRALRQVVAMLPNARSAADAEERSELAVARLHKLLFERAAEPQHETRIISRGEIADIMGVPQDQPATKRWNGLLISTYLASARSQDLGAFVEPVIQGEGTLLSTQEPDNSDGKPSPITCILQGTAPVILVGRTGTGKSTITRLLRKHGATSAQAVLISHAETYIPGRLDALCADAIADVIASDVPSSTGQQALFDDNLLFVIDGVSEIPLSARTALREDLRVLVASGRGARLVLVGRDVAAAREILPATVTPATYQTVELNYERRLELATRSLKPIAQVEGESGNQPKHPRALLALVDRALGDARGNPMLLTMGLKLLASGESFSGRAGVYEKFIEQLGARSGAASLSYMVACLGVVYARLLSQGRRYSDPFEWDHLLSEGLDSLRLSSRMDAESINESAKRAGLIVPVGYTQTVAPLHDSFADFLAGKAHAHHLVTWPAEVASTDDQRLLFAAEIGGVSHQLAQTVVRFRPFLSVRLAEFDKEELNEEAPEQIAQLLRQLTGEPRMSVTLNRRLNGQTIAFRRDEAQSCWITKEETADLLKTNAACLSAGGRLAIVSRLWRVWVREQLKGDAKFDARPEDWEGAVSCLDAHAREVVSVIEAFIEAVAPPGHQAELAAAIGLIGLRAEVGPEENGDWPVIYRASPEVQISKVSISDIAMTERDGGRSTVRHLLSTSPSEEASRRVKKALDELTYDRWASQR